MRRVQIELLQTKPRFYKYLEFFNPNTKLEGKVNIEIKEWKIYKLISALVYFVFDLALSRLAPFWNWLKYGFFFIVLGGRISSWAYGSQGNRYFPAINRHAVQGSRSTLIWARTFQPDRSGTTFSQKTNLKVKNTKPEVQWYRSILKGRHSVGQLAALLYSEWVWDH